MSTTEDSSSKEDVTKVANAARFLMDPRVKEVEMDTLVRFVQNKLGYSTEDAKAFVVEVRSNKKIQQMLERAVEPAAEQPAPAASAPEPTEQNSNAIEEARAKRIISAFIADPRLASFSRDKLVAFAAQQLDYDIEKARSLVDAQMALRAQERGSGISRPAVARRRGDGRARGNGISKPQERIKEATTAKVVEAKPIVAEAACAEETEKPEAKVVEAKPIVAEAACAEETEKPDHDLMRLKKLLQNPSIADIDDEILLKFVNKELSFDVSLEYIREVRAELKEEVRNAELEEVHNAKEEVHNAELGEVHNAHIVLERELINLVNQDYETVDNVKDVTVLEKELMNLVVREEKIDSAEEKVEFQERNIDAGPKVYHKNRMTVTQRFRMQSFLRDPRTQGKSDAELVHFLSESMQLERATVMDNIRLFRREQRRSRGPKTQNARRRHM